jgi:hypothetical protein
MLSPARQRFTLRQTVSTIEKADITGANLTVDSGTNA